MLGNQVEDYVASRKVNPGGGECDDGFRFGVVKFFNSQKVSQRSLQVDL